MADLKISELPAVIGSNLAADDLFVIVDTNNTATKSLSVLDLVGNIPSNTSVTGTLSVSGNTSITGNLKLNGPTTPASNNATTQFGANPKGNIVWDANYLYIAVSDNDAEGTLKRVALSDFIP